MLFFASVQFSNVVTSETPLWFKLATMYLLLISSHVTKNHGYISYRRYIESEGKWLIQGFVTLVCVCLFFSFCQWDRFENKNWILEISQWGGMSMTSSYTVPTQPFYTNYVFNYELLFFFNKLGREIKTYTVWSVPRVGTCLNTRSNSA